MNDRLTLIILGVFAIVTLALLLARQLMREVAQTAQEWQRLRVALRGEDADVPAGTAGHTANECNGPSVASQPDAGSPNASPPRTAGGHLGDTFDGFGRDW